MSKIYIVTQHTVNGKKIHPFTTTKFSTAKYTRTTTLIPNAENGQKIWAKQYFKTGQTESFYDVFEFTEPVGYFGFLFLSIVPNCGYKLSEKPYPGNSSTDANACVFKIPSGEEPSSTYLKESYRHGYIRVCDSSTSIKEYGYFQPDFANYDYIIDYNFVEASSSDNIECSFKMYFDHSSKGGGYADISPELLQVPVISNLDQTSETGFLLKFDNASKYYSNSQTLINAPSYRLYIEKSNTNTVWNSVIRQVDEYTPGCYFGYAAIASCFFEDDEPWPSKGAGFLSPAVTEPGDYVINCSLDLRLCKYITGVKGQDVEKVLEGTSLIINLLDLLTYNYAYQGVDVESESPDVRFEISAYNSGTPPTRSGNYLTFTDAATVTIKATATSLGTEKSYSTSYTITVKNKEEGTVKNALLVSPQWDDKYQDALKGISLKCQKPEKNIVLVKNASGQWYKEWYMPSYDSVEWTLNIELAQGFTIQADKDGYKFKFYYYVTENSSDWWFKENTFSFDFSEVGDECWKLDFTIKESSAPSTGLKSGDLYVMVNGAKKRLIVKDSKGNIVGHLVAK